MPDLMASHWGINGEVNGYYSKAFALYFMPILSLFFLGLFLFLPKIDPYKKNFSQFKNYYKTFVNLIFIFLFYLYLLTIVWNLGNRFNMIQLISPAFAILFFYAGILLANTKRNWFVGIRTPWTLSNPEVWKKTHVLGSRLFKLCAILCLFGVILPQFALYFILFPIILTSIFLFVYSYLEYRKIKLS